MQKKGEAGRERAGQRREAASPRAPWVAPSVVDHGSIRHLVRSATGPQLDSIKTLGKMT